MKIAKGDFRVVCGVRCKDCGGQFEKEIGWATFASDVWEQMGWRRGVGGVWLCSTCFKLRKHQKEREEHGSARIQEES